MTAQLLTSELSTLIQESKRKNPDLRSAAEKSLGDLKNLPRTSEAQIAADLKSRPFFVQPFLLACRTRNPKFAGSGIVGLQRLVVANALPKDTLTEVLEAFRECSTLALDVQLKVLQALPSLLQNYAGNLTGQVLVTAFQVCFLLYGNKTAVVSNTAAAALQQLVSTTFEKVAIKDNSLQNGESTVEVPISDGNVSVGGVVLDAYRLLEDVSLLTDGQKPKSLVGASLSQNFGLELLESILGNHADTIIAHPEQIHVIRTRVMPLIIRVLSEKSTFASTVRTMRLLQLIIRRVLSALAEECEVALSLLNHMLDADAASVWKRALCLELFRSLHAESALMRDIYSHYDTADEKRNIVRDHLGSLVRLASEKPALIGLGQQSSIPTSLGQTDDSDEQAAIQAGGLAGSIGASVATSEINRQGIGAQWSSIRVPCLDMLDKSEAPILPATYIYSLTLTCITTFSEGLARFLLPYTVPSDSKSKRKSKGTQDDNNSGETDGTVPPKSPRAQSYRGRRTPRNPLNLTEHVQRNQISISGQMVEQCWPALLAASSTYLNATLDSENYHALIRSFQKFTQIAGLLDLATPRDAFLTTLGKHAVPAMNSSVVALSTKARNASPATDDMTDSEPDSNPAVSLRRQSNDVAAPTMNTRHLLCLRALLNLGIALGPVLKESWTIILEALLQADLLLSHSGRNGRKKTRSSSSRTESEEAARKADTTEDLGLEIIAVETAAARLLEATADLSSEAFLDFLRCLSSLLNMPGFQKPTANPLLSPQPGMTRHQRLRSFSGSVVEADVLAQSNGFIIAKIDEVAGNNAQRLVQSEASESGWELLSNVLNSIIGADEARPDTRVRAAHALDSMLVSATTPEDYLTADEKDLLQGRSLDALYHEISLLRRSLSKGTKSSQNCDVEIHRLVLEALKSVLEQCGESLNLGWQSVLAIINSVFIDSPDKGTIQVRSPKLVRSAFDSIQLVCSDFLSAVPSTHLLALLNTLYSFCAQNQDLNISLTSTTFFRNVSDHLLQDVPSINLAPLSSSKLSDFDIAQWTKTDDVEMSASTLWLCLLLRLKLLSIDVRLEVRHSALHTLFRILDTCSERLTAAALNVCFDNVLIELFMANEEEISKARDRGEADVQGASSWNQTAIVTTEGVSDFVSQLLSTLKNDQNLATIIQNLLKHLAIVLKRQALGVSHSIFVGTSKMFSAVAEVSLDDKIWNSVLDHAWGLWVEGNPALHKDDTEKQRNDNQDALKSYLELLEQLLRLTGGSLSLERIDSIIAQLRICVIGSTASPYSTDLDRMTPVQGAVLKCLTSVPDTTPGAVSRLVQCCDYFSSVAYEQNEEPSSKKTYVALSKAAMTLQQSLVIKHSDELGVDGTSIAVASCHALAIPIGLKYKWKSVGKGDPPWRKATTTALTILEASMPIVQDSAGEFTPFWEVVVKIFNSVISADCDAYNDRKQILKDQDFDIDAFSRLKILIIPSIGSPAIPDTTRRKFAESIFQNSLIHEPNIDDLARPGQELLSGLQSEHIGRVKDLPPSPRSKLAYLLLDELFSLVSVHDGSPAQIKLAQAAAPYLILRCGLVLRAYIYDHPLRGLMPMPRSQKKEMFYMLRKLVDLESEPRAIPAGEGVTSKHKKHLHRLYPLVMKALKTAWRHEEMAEKLEEVLDAVGDDFGI